MNKYRRTLVLVHVVVASFFLPMGLMFAITGGLYTVSVKGAYASAKHQVPLAEPLAPELGSLVKAAEGLLNDMSQAHPTGGASLKKIGSSYQLEWTGVNRDVLLTPTADPMVAELEIKDTSAYRRFVQLHKAKGSTLGKAVSVAWGAGLLVLLATGMAIALSTDAYRRVTLATSVSGIVVLLLWYLIG